jgi:hypothetical protein
MTNVAFLRTRIEFIEHFFSPGEVESIWITFPDLLQANQTGASLQYLSWTDTVSF